jgi:integrase
MFLYKGRPIEDIRTALRRACREAGIPHGRSARDGLVFHYLRHSLNTYMRKAGVPKSVIMRLTGHSTRKMFDRQNTVDTEDARRPMDQLQGYLFKKADTGLDQGSL